MKTHKKTYVNPQTKVFRYTADVIRMSLGGGAEAQSDEVFTRENTTTDNVNTNVGNF